MRAGLLRMLLLSGAIAAAEPAWACVVNTGELGLFHRFVPSGLPYRDVGVRVRIEDPGTPEGLIRARVLKVLHGHFTEDTILIRRPPGFDGDGSCFNFPRAGDEGVIVGKLERLPTGERALNPRGPQRAHHLRRGMLPGYLAAPPP